jgi:hypothetical protein
MWGVAYTGQLTALMGDNITKVALSTECYDVSDNFVTINRVGKEKNNVANINTRSSEATNERSTIAPNPVLSDAILYFSPQIDADAPVTIQIFNSLGAVVSNNTTNGTQTNLDFNSLPPSLYFVKIIQNDYSEIHKVLKK